jgi:uncharacterized protein YcfJ
MLRLEKLTFTAAEIALACLSAAGCAGVNHTGNGALLGSGLGAVTGAMIGDHNGNAGAGALIGAASGALAGGLLGNAEDAREERDAAIAQANYERQTRMAQQYALTNNDVARMSQSGVSDSVIIGSIQSRGGRFDTSPDAIIGLKQGGVSDLVIQTMQHAPPALAAPYQETVVVPRSPTRVYVEPYPPAPSVVVVPRRVVFGWGHHGHYHRRARHHW